MERETKFRVWVASEKEMYYGNSKKGITIKEIAEQKISSSLYNNDGLIGGLVWLEFTGIKGENGKEIYGGHVVTQGELTGEVCMWIESGQWVVRYNKTFCMALSSGTWEIIGSIHENPELRTTT